MNSNNRYLWFIEGLRSHENLHVLHIFFLKGENTWDLQQYNVLSLWLMMLQIDQSMKLYMNGKVNQGSTCLEAYWDLIGWFVKCGRAWTGMIGKRAIAEQDFYKQTDNRYLAQCECKLSNTIDTSAFRL